MISHGRRGLVTLGLSACPLLYGACETPKTDAPDGKGKTAAIGPIEKIERDAIGCTGPQPCRVTLSIELLGATKDVGPDDPPKEGKRPVAVIKNEGKFRTAMYEFKPSTEAWYYVHLKKGGFFRNKGKWQVDEWLINRGELNEKFLDGAIEQCHVSDQYKTSRVFFYSCSRPQATAPTTNRMSMLSALFAPLKLILAAAGQGDTTDTSRAPPGGEDPLWMSCTSGCCQLSQS